MPSGKENEMNPNPQGVTVYRISHPGMVRVELFTEKAKYVIPGVFRNLWHARSHSEPLNILKT